MLAPRELRVRYRQSVLDIAWALINPVVVLAVYGYILTQSFDVTSACAPYLTSAWTGLIVWTFFATAVGSAVTSLISSTDLITKVYFPRETIPLSIAGATLADLGVGFVTLVVLMFIQRVPLTWWALVSILPIAVIVVWSAAISIFASVIASFVRDAVHAVHLAIRVGFFATPVMYEASTLPPSVQWTAQVNPVAVSIEGMRATLLCGMAPAWRTLSIQLAVAGLALVAGVLYTRSVEARMVDVL
jgi:lipopolysaccharide transport system permease protein